MTIVDDNPVHIHTRLLHSKTFGVAVVLLCEKGVVVYDAHKWHLRVSGKRQTNPRDNWYYVQRSIHVGEKRRNIQLHREIMGVINVVGADLSVDHRNRNGLDNRIENLRLCTIQQNQFNEKKSINNTSGFKNVSWNKKAKKWESYITLNRKRIYLGLFDTAEKAHIKYCEKGVELFGEFFNPG